MMIWDDLSCWLSSLLCLAHSSLPTALRVMLDHLSAREGSRPAYGDELLIDQYVCHSKTFMASCH